VGQGRGQHIYLDDELGKLAGAVVAQIRPGRSDRESREDCWQAAYVAGLRARASAQRSHAHISYHVLMLKMRDTVYRMLRARKEVREADLLLA
jgi:hypothetical protein